MNKELLDNIDKQLSKVEKAIRKHTQAINLHDMSRRHPVTEDRNKLAGDVYDTREALDGILSTAREQLQAEREKMKCCVSMKVEWVNKHSDLSIGSDDDGYVDINLFRCAGCGKITADAD